MSTVQKQNRKKFADWVKNNFNKDDINTWLFSDEKLFDIDSAYNSQNDRIWAVSRPQADVGGRVKRKRKFPTIVMVWMGTCNKGLTPLVILDKGTVNHERYIKEVLPVALRFGNKMFGDDWHFQQDGATAHTRNLSQKWCHDNFPSFIPKDRWPANSPDLNPLEYSIWNELVETMDWSQIQTKVALIQELKRAVKRMRPETVFSKVVDVFRIDCTDCWWTTATIFVERNREFW